VPVLVVVVVAKWVGDLLNEGLYDSFIHLLQVPILPPDHPPEMKFYRYLFLRRAHANHRGKTLTQTSILAPTLHLYSYFGRSRIAD
jgi:hypothetical protein